MQKASTLSKFDPFASQPDRLEPRSGPASHVHMHVYIGHAVLSCGIQSTLCQANTHQLKGQRFHSFICYLVVANLNVITDQGS